jgi:hypothetical protein
MTPVTAGKQSHSLLIRNAATQGVQDKLVISLVSKKQQYIRFLDIQETSNPVLDLGYCYIDPKKTFVKVTPFRIENLLQEPLFISVESNLSNQVLVFQDEALTKPASSVGEVTTPTTPTTATASTTHSSSFSSDNQVSLAPRTVSVVYICLQPSLKSEIYNEGHCRELVGGIRAKGIPSFPSFS